jgi:hypothetical protein
MPVTADITGLTAVGRAVRSSITQGLLDAGQHIHDLAQQLAPEETGDLKNSGDIQILNDYMVEISFGNGLPDDRAPANELGTVFSPAQPFLIPAVMQVNIAQEIAKYLINKGTE